MRSFFFRIYQMFLRSSRKRQIVLSVWLAHFLFLCFLLTGHFFSSSRPIGRPIAIRTVLETPKVIDAPKPAKSAAPKLQKPAASLPKKTPAAKSPSKPAPPRGPKKSPEAPKNALVDIQNALSELKQLEKKKESSLALPSKLHLVSAEKEISFSNSYREILSSYLQEVLDLPEYGAVKIKLRIDREGKLLESEILSSENRKNSEFLKNRLQGLTFPCFNDFDVPENSLTFIISFRNAEL
ncbi:MAG: hypothetical protein IT584_02690 [Chlamydiae bacterium]|nr:hypothetical protein [Chlamydiota bacterium]